VPTIQVTGGSPQSTVISTAFGQALEATVKDSNGNPVSGVTVTFTVPASGASATLSSLTAVTDANGHARVTATANGTVGSYNVTATAAGATGTATFALTNTTTSPPSPQGVPATTMPVLILTSMALIGMVVWLRRRAA
jgi:adhesin/invasin